MSDSEHDGMIQKDSLLLPMFIFFKGMKSNRNTDIIGSLKDMFYTE